jgi:cobalt/nickel transport protein
VRKEFWAFTFAAFLLAVALGTFLSPFASPDPDGLEKIADAKGFSEKAQEEPVWAGSPMPDYTVPAVRHEKLSKGLAGLIGTVAIFLAAIVVARLVISVSGIIHARNEKT